MTTTIRGLIGLLVVCASASANDSYFYRAKGYTPVPAEFIEIAIVTENLVIELVDDLTFDVAVDFVMHNSLCDTTITVGFITPADYLGFTRSEGHEIKTGEPHPNIHNFSISMNGDSLLYSVITYPREERSANHGFDMAYLFEAPFVEGSNTIKHRYRVKFDEGETFGYNFDYILTSGCRWGGGQISEFTLTVKPGDDTIVAVTPFMSGEQQSSKWSLVGEGRLSTEPHITGFGDKLLYAYAREGVLMYEERDFCPETELRIHVPWYASSSGWLGDYDGIPIRAGDLDYPTFGVYGIDRIMTKIDVMSEQQRKFLHDYILALHGFAFESRSRQELFRGFIWYCPDPAVRQETIKYTESELEILRALAAYE